MHIEQGQDLQEQPVVDANGNIITDNGDASGGDSGGRPPKTPKFGPKQIALCAAFLVVGVMAVYMLMHKKPVEPEDTTPTTSTYSDPVGLFEPVDDTPKLTSTVSSTQTQPVQSTPAPTQSGNRTDVVNPYTYTGFTMEEVRTLRGCGYTGDEIEYFYQQGYTVDAMVEVSQRLKDKEFEAWRASVLDSASPEYKALMEQTFLGGKETRSEIEADGIKIVYTRTENVDYEKIGTFNYQTWVKVHLSYCDVFMSVPLERYSQLAPTGNMVVSFTLRCNADNKIVQITNIEEVMI